MGAPEVFLVCQGCLSDDRRCNVIVGKNLNTFLRILDPDGDSKMTLQDINCLFLCWECDATLRRIRAFQLKVQKARNALKKVYLPNSKPQCLSNLKTTITKTKYDFDINTSLKFKEVTVLKIGPDGKTIPDLSEKNVIFSNNLNTEIEVEVFPDNSPKNGDLSDNYYDMNDSDELSDDKPIINLKFKKKVLKKKSSNKDCKNSIKVESSCDTPVLFDPLAGRPSRQKKLVEKLDVSIIKPSRKRGRPKLKKKNEQKELFPKLPKGTRSRPVKVKETKWKCIDAPISEDENFDRPAKEDDHDPSFIAPIKNKTNHIDENSKYTKVQIDKRNLLQYFTKYTLSVSEYRSFLQELSKTPYFMSERKKCNKCVVKFLNEEDYVQHMRLHDSSSGQFSCSLCDLHFLDKDRLVTHTASHLSVQQCNICKQTCGLQHSLRVHMQTVHREGSIYKCQSCTLVFDSRSAVCQHFDKLHKRLVCNECGKFQYSKRTMDTHFRSRHVPPVCPHCHARLKNYTYLRTHLILRHNYPEKKKSKMEDMYCVECDKQFTSMLKFRTHTSTVHRPGKANISVQCKDCGKMIRKNFLRTHYDFYHGEPRFKCDICNKPFAKKESMQRHISVFHLGQRPVKDKPCYICGRLFTTNRILTHHIRTHTGEKPFSCDYCPATFAQKAAKYIHYKNVHKRRLDNSSVDAGEPADPRMALMGQMGPTDVGFMEMEMIRPPPPLVDCSGNICHSVMTGGGT